MRILNVDDNAENRYLIEALFRGQGHEVVSAANGEEALATAKEAQFDAIVSDLLMPKMDGFQLIRELRRDTRLNRVPILVYTATYTDEKDKELALSLGADRFLLKPAEPSELVRAVDETIRARAAGQPAPATPPADAEGETLVLKQYNARLIAKLEKKMQDLEQANRALQADIELRQRAEAERARLEEQLRHAQKMEAIGTLAGGIAHDFNNILTGIMCAAELGRLESNLPETVRASFGDILCASARARDLVRQILAFSRQQEVERWPLDLRPLVAEAVRFLRSTIPATVALEADLARDLPKVLVDATQVHQVVTNLCTNAWHAIGNRPAGRIKIQIRAAQIKPGQAAVHSGLRPGNYVCLSVADNGCGMDATTRSRALDPFFTTKPAGVGTGLGLSVVHGIMRSSNGAIVIESEVGRGSTFHLYFPVYEAAAETAKEPASDVPGGNGQRVLLVDDEPMLARLGERLLERLGYSALAFTSPERALEALRTHGADAVLVDYSMPGCNGLEFAKLARQHRPAVPVLLVTGYDSGLDSNRIAACGLSGVLHKPYSRESLAQLLRAALK